MSKHVGLGPLLEEELWKECTRPLRLRRCDLPEMVKGHLEQKKGVVEKVHAFVARSRF